VFPPYESNKTLTSPTDIALKNYLHPKKKIIARVKPIWDLLTIIFNGDKLLITTTKMAYMSDLVCLLYASALSLHFYTKREKNRLYNHSCSNKASGWRKK
jgi:hypothetical protein